MVVQCVAGDLFRFTGTGLELDFWIDVDTRMVENKAERGSRNRNFSMGRDRRATA